MQIEDTQPADNTAIVQMKGVTKCFKRGEFEQHVLKSVDFQFSAGTLSAIMGVSGAGKSTLLNLIGGIDQVDEGILKVCGVSLDGASPKTLTKFRQQKVGFIFQFHNLLPSLSALENVLLALEANNQSLSKKDYSIAMDYLDSVGLASKAKKFPNQLSGGEQQRVAIARALVKQPPLVLADEPTGNLDEENGERIANLLRNIQSNLGVTVCMVTHNPNLAEVCDNVFRLSGGELNTDKSSFENQGTHQ